MKILGKTCLFLGVIISFLIDGYTFSKETNWKEVRPLKSNFTLSFPATATVGPLIRVDMNPPVSGRIDQVLVEEGAQITKGQIMAYMSSMDRAALMDVAKTESKAAQKKWEEMYKPIALVAPISGKIVKSEIVPGQTVTMSTTLFVIADKLVIKAQVDETDVGKVIIGQMVNVRTDAFPMNPFICKVKRIAHQSQLINNVNIYEVILESDQMPAQIRSGMGASANFIVLEKENSLLLPSWIAQGQENIKKEMMVGGPKGQKVKRIVELGKSNGTMIEVISNLQEQDIVFFAPLSIETKKKNILGF